MSYGYERVAVSMDYKCLAQATSRCRQGTCQGSTFVCELSQ